VDGREGNLPHSISDDTPLFTAVRNGHLECMKLLVDAGADVNSRDRLYNMTPMMVAAENKHIGCMKYLRHRGAYLELKGLLDTRIGDLTALHDVLSRGREYDEVAKTLIVMGAECPTPLSAAEKTMYDSVHAQITPADRISARPDCNTITQAIDAGMPHTMLIPDLDGAEVKLPVLLADNPLLLWELIDDTEDRRPVFTFESCEVNFSEICPLLKIPETATDKDISTLLSILNSHHAPDRAVFVTWLTYNFHHLSTIFKLLCDETSFNALASTICSTRVIDSISIALNVLRNNSAWLTQHAAEISHCIPAWESYWADDLSKLMAGVPNLYNRLLHFHEDHDAFGSPIVSPRDLLIALARTGVPISNLDPLAAASLLHAAAKDGKFAFVQYLLLYEFDIDARNDEGFTALTIAAKYGHLDCLKLLVDANADVHAVDDSVKSAVQSALDQASSHDDKVCDVFIRDLEVKAANKLPEDLFLTVQTITKSLEYEVRMSVFNAFMTPDDTLIDGMKLPVWLTKQGHRALLLDLLKRKLILFAHLATSDVTRMWQNMTILDGLKGKELVRALHEVLSIMEYCEDTLEGAMAPVAVSTNDCDGPANFTAWAKPHMQTVSVLLSGSEDGKFTSLMRAIFNECVIDWHVVMIAIVRGEVDWLNDKAGIIHIMKQERGMDDLTPVVDAMMEDPDCRDLLLLTTSRKTVKPKSESSCDGYVTSPVEDNVYETRLTVHGDSSTDESPTEHSSLLRNSRGERPDAHFPVPPQITAKTSPSSDTSSPRSHPKSTPLHVASRFGLSYLLSALLCHKANPCVLDNHKHYPLVLAAMNGHFTCLKAMLPDVVSDDDGGKIVEYFRWVYQQLKLKFRSIKQCCKRKEVQNDFSSEQKQDYASATMQKKMKQQIQRAMHKATIHNHHECVDYLVKRGASRCRGRYCCYLFILHVTTIMNFFAFFIGIGVTLLVTYQA
jgi:ankyrin repeat protein